MLVTPSRATRARCAGVVSLAGLSPSSVVLIRESHHQTRTFRFGRPWSCYSENDTQQDGIYRRHRSFRYRYTENLNRRSQGEDPSPFEDAKTAIQRLAGDYWHHRGEQKSRWSNRRCNETESEGKTFDNPEGIRPGQNIEDVERAPLENLLFGSHSGVLDRGDLPRKMRNRRHFAGFDDPSPGAFATRSSGTTLSTSSEYTIDPITNRKVFKSSSEGPADRGHDLDKGFKSYRLRFSAIGTPIAEVSHHSASPVENTGSKPNNPEPQPARQPVLESEQYVADINNTPVANILDTLSAKHQDVSWHHGDGIGPTPEKSLNESRTTDVPLNHQSSKPQAQDDALGPTPQQHGDPNLDAPGEHLEPSGKASEKKAVPEYDDLAGYGAFRSHEPDGMYKDAEEPTVDSQELKKYNKPFRSHEPDGKYAARYAEPDLDASELAEYSQPYLSHEPDGKYADRQETHSAVQDEASHYEAVWSHKPDGKYAAADAKAPPTPQELGEYKPFRSHEPDGKYAEQDEADSEAPDLGNHEAFGYEDSEPMPVVADPPVTEAPSELSKYDAVRYYEPDGRVTAGSEKEGHDQEELEKYQTFKWNEPDGKPTEQGSSPQETAASETTHYRKMLELLMAQSAAESDAIDSSTSSALRQSKNRREPNENAGLTGNYARDFPEEFTKTWSTENSESGSTLLPTDIGASEASQNADPVATGAVGLDPAAILEPALDRHSKSQQPLTKNTTKTADKESIADAPIPTLYKVLVYDPIMQRIDTAETTSTVPDTTAPLTPAQVLLRISNPAKFLPHFGPLQAQGFEIVSGAGDVLIFRKALDADTRTELPSAAPAIPDPVAAPVRASVNPIDMTGEPRDYTVAADRFASPTGFVNYDLPPPRAESAINVQPEEPVSSKPEEEPKKKKKGKASLPKRMVVGAVWVAGVSYSLGVLGEYFRAGGTDKKGPKGF